MKKKILSVFSVLLTISILICTQASATHTSSIYGSPACLSDSWIKTGTVTLATTTSRIYGGDVGVSFYASNVVLPNSFIKSSNRHVYVELFDEDSVVNDIAKRYTGYFGNPNSANKPTSWSNTYTNPNEIEYDSSAELFIKFKIEKISGDTTRNVPAGLLKFQYWLN